MHHRTHQPHFATKPRAFPNLPVLDTSTTWFGRIQEDTTEPSSGSETGEKYAGVPDRASASTTSEAPVVQEPGVV